MKYFHCLFIVMLCFGTVAMAQEKSTKSCFLKINELTIQEGVGHEGGNSFLFEDFYKLYPNSALLKSDFTGFRSGNDPGTLQNVFSVGVGFGNTNETSTLQGPFFRLGITALNGGGFSANRSREQAFPYDTLTSSQTQLLYILDSTQYENYSMRYKYQQIRLDFSCLYRTSQAKRISLFAGLGVNAGVSLNSQTRIAFSTRYTIESESMGIPGRKANFDVNENSEIKNNKTNMGGSVYVPMGIDYRLGKNSEFWKVIHLSYEMRPGIYCLRVPETGTYSGFSIQHSLGMRFTF